MAAQGSYSFFQSQRGRLAPSNPEKRITCLPPIPAGKNREQVSWTLGIAERAQQGLDSLGLAREDTLEARGSQQSLRRQLLGRGSYFLTGGGQAGTVLLDPERLQRQGPEKEGRISDTRQYLSRGETSRSFVRRDIEGAWLAWRGPQKLDRRGVLYCQSQSLNQRFLFTEEEKKRVFWEAHAAGDQHHGTGITCARLSKKYFWLGMTFDVKKWIKKCKVCQDRGIRMAAQSALEARSMGVPLEESRAKAPQDPDLLPPICMPALPRGDLYATACTLPRSSLPPQDKGLFSFVSLQLLGPLEQTPRGARFAFVAVDYFTKCVHTAPMATCSPEETSRQILELVMTFGLPEGIISAQQPAFILQLNKILKMALKLQCNLVVQYNPQTDWFLRNTQSYVRRLLSLVLTTNPTDWDQHLHKIFFLQNTHWACDEEEYMSHLDIELQEASSAKPGEKQPLTLASPETLETPVSKDSLGKAHNKDICLYCNQLPDEGDSDVFAVLQCKRCQAWAHDLCVKRQHGHNYQKISFWCRACLWGDGAVGPGPGPFPRAPEAMEP
ncbi:uncharacterized protein LOC141518634 [Macrotis lagotis]|uniref:uncharacterized protein LOC141518634 n=1 Tax=Macrotis lagotis TaxID=92651 RepID=UPI003D686562